MTKRLRSFKPWTISCEYIPESLAEAGFIYWGVDDEVQCFVCGVILHNWPKQLSVLGEHIHWSPNCRYAQLKRHDPQSLIEIWDIPAVMAIQDQFYSKQIIEKAFNELKIEGVSNPDAGKLMSKVLELDAVQSNIGISDDEEDIYGCTVEGQKYIPLVDAIEEHKTEKKVTIPSTVIKLQCEKYVKIDLKKKHETMAKIAQLTEENKVLKERITCKLCPAQLNTVFLPCGHTVVCMDCTKKRKYCVKCMTLIRGIVKVYLA